MCYNYSVFRRCALQKIFKKFNILLVVALCILQCNISYSENATSSTQDYVHSVNPYYSYWKNEFIIYIDNYLGNINDVSKKDLMGDKGSSNIYIFTKLTDGKYDYDTLLKDIKNSDVENNLHDKNPILVHLPKNAYNNESHALLKDDNEKGKLITGGPYSKYEKYPNGFYYKDKKIDSAELNKILATYKIEADKISDQLKQIKSYSIKDLYGNVFVAYLTNGATSVAGTEDAKIYLLNVDKKLNPYDLTISDLTSDDVITGKSTKGYLPDDWQVETIYIYNQGHKLIEKLSYDTFRQYLWAKQEKSVIEWMKSLYN